jgi:hypothetical protein
MAYNYQIGMSYSFNVYGTGVIGNDYQNVKVLGVMSADLASRLGLDIQSLQQKMYPQVPPANNMPTDPTQFNYVQLQNGSRTILGMPWIDESSIVPVTGQTITAIIGNCTTDDLAVIRDALALNGYTQVSISIST